MDPSYHMPPQTNFGLIQFTAIPVMKPFSCPYSMTTKGGAEQFSGKIRPYFFNQTIWPLLHVFVWLLFEGGVYFIGKLADSNEGWIRYVQAIQRQLLATGQFNFNPLFVTASFMQLALRNQKYIIHLR